MEVVPGMVGGCSGKGKNNQKSKIVKNKNKNTGKLQGVWVDPRIHGWCGKQLNDTRQRFLTIAIAFSLALRLVVVAGVLEVQPCGVVASVRREL